jgi:Fuc2NAc and GlcNAc transferase
MILAVATSVAASYMVTSILSKLAPRIGMIDTPNPRSSHVRPTPRGGGLGVIAGVAVGVAVLSIFGPTLGNRLSWLLIGSVAIAAVGLIDDLRRAPAILRLLLHVLIATGVSAALGGVTNLPLPAPLDVPTGPLAIPLGALWLASVTNFYNFMDGIDGLAAGQAAVSCFGVAIAAWSHDVVAFAIIVVASCAGFLVLNRPPAKIFLGDVGSTSIGFTLAGLALVAGPGQRSSAVFAVAVGLTLFLLDPVETLLRLARRGHRIGSAHRLHSYQVLARGYHNPAAVTVALLTAGLVLSVGGAVAFGKARLAWPVLVLGVGAFAVERYLAARKEPIQEALSAT